MGYTYVSGMCRECIGYVSGMYRKIQGGENEKKMIFLAKKNLVVSGKFSTFAGESDLHYQNYRRFRGVRYQNYRKL